VSGLPGSIRDAIAEKLGNVGSVRGVSGGMVNDAAEVDTSSGKVFVKWKSSAPHGLFTCEANGLSALRGASSLSIPEVLLVSDPPASNASRFLVLEWIDGHPPRDRSAFGRRLAEGLAELHARNAAPDGQYGLDYDNYLGSLEQINSQAATWTEFYRDQRLGTLLRLGERAGWLSRARALRLGALMQRCDSLLAHANTQAVLIHGDLWSGNFMSAGETPVLIDPAIHYADREVEMAFVELFGGFPPRFRQMYEEAMPLDPGYIDRRPLLQLYPLLVHLRHFGEEYGPAVDAVFDLYGV
jgi:fructosamine-3-kinase